MNDALNRFSRNKDLIDQRLLDNITLIGAGGIGSNVVPLLSIMGFNYLSVYDGDVLEPHNLSTTAYPASALDQTKAFTAANIFQQYNGVAADAHGMWSIGDSLTPKVIMGPDNMEVRRDVYEQWVGQEDRELLVDLRMGALALEIITVTPEHDHFMDTYAASDDIADEVCTAKHTIFTGSLAASFGVNQIFNILSGKPFYEEIWIGLNPLNIHKKSLAIPNIG